MVCLTYPTLYRKQQDSRSKFQLNAANNKLKFLQPTSDMQKRMNQLQISATNFDSNSNNNSNDKHQTALIAGLTTGLVVLALIAVTIAGFVFYRRRKLQKILLQQQDEKKPYIPPNPPIIISDVDTVLPPPHSSSLKAVSVLPPISEFSSSSSATPILNHWHQQQAIDIVDYDHPQSPFIIGAQSLQIPHLDIPDPPSPSSATLIRRSLNIQQTIIADNGDYLSRASSVKVTKYDHRPIPIKNRSCDVKNAHDENDNSSDEKDQVTIRRAVSVKKNNSTASHSSSITRVGSVSSEDLNVICAKPTMVRINTITSKEGGITRKRSIRTVVDEQQYSSFEVSLQDPSTEDDQSDRIDFYFCPPAPPPPVLHNPSQVSIKSSNSSSTIGDGEITVFWEPGHQPPP
ncbi:hypothetical protein [Parasitella parasitica]|uniref:Uncharacterized protein n=1 Tax=Parasitella parasitica TaxID=35722 RepID=A0A0B7NI44_9FUNG|nr:hypothetical protein [Parasitella parasitica]